MQPFLIILPLRVYLLLCNLGLSCVASMNSLQTSAGGSLEFGNIFYAPISEPWKWPPALSFFGEIYLKRNIFWGPNPSSLTTMISVNASFKEDETEDQSGIHPYFVWVKRTTVIKLNSLICDVNDCHLRTSSLVAFSCILAFSTIGNFVFAYVIVSSKSSSGFHHQYQDLDHHRSQW